MFSILSCNTFFAFMKNLQSTEASAHQHIEFVLFFIIFACMDPDPQILPRKSYNCIPYAKGES
jgi:hypothetical protein